MRILIAEDEALIADGLSIFLKNASYAVDVVDNGLHALEALQNEHFDLLILDVGLPGLDGFQVLTKLRQLKHENAKLPVLVLTARDAIDDRITGLDSGADDYMIKPFDIHELSARIRALIRRNQGRAEPLIKHGELVINPASYQVSYKNKPVELLPKEFSILLCLVNSQGKVVSKEKLEESLYAWDSEVESNVTEVHIHHLRKKISKDFIKTVRGLGYIVP